MRFRTPWVSHGSICILLVAFAALALNSPGVAATAPAKSAKEVAGPSEAPLYQPGAPKLLFVATDADGGNGDDELEPGETVGLKIKLYNEGNERAISVHGTLDYLGNRTDVTILDKTATWPDLPPRGAPQFTDAPHFQVQTASTLPCGAVLPFRVTVTTGTGELFDIDFSIKIGQRIDSDMLQDAVRRFTEQEASFWGADSGDYLGNSVSWGDINGDGYADMILGAYRAYSLGNARVGAGEVYLVYGKAAQWTDTDLLSPPAGVVRFWGADTGDQLGHAVASGDINGDGYDDLILAAAGGDSTGNSRNSAGEVYLIYGKAAQWTDTDLLSPPAGVVRFWGADIGDLLNSVSSGDVNGDGYADLIIGAAQGDSIDNARNVAGEVYLIYGKAAQWVDTDLLSPPAGVARFWGAEYPDSLGASVASGDVNGDNYDDLIIGAKGATSAGNSRVNAGEVYLVYGKAAQWTDTDLLSPPAGLVRFWGADPGDSLGETVAFGDTNGDGYEDLILGARYASSLGNSRPSTGEVYLIYGKAAQWTDTDLLSPPAGVVRFWGAETPDYFGYAIASGDVNGDGYDDLLLGARQAYSLGNLRNMAGEVYLVYGKAAQWTDTDLLSPPAGVARFWGADGGDTLGDSVASGDINGDGYDDLILGATGGRSTGNSRVFAGELYLIYGTTTDTLYGRTDTYSFIDASIGTKLNLSCDDCSVAFPVGFGFPFYGDIHSTVYVASNGFIAFSPIHDLGSADVTCPPTRRQPNNLIAPFWDDLNPGAGAAASGVYALLQGTEPNRRLTIEWKDVPHYPSVGTATFEVTLFESSGEIFFQYQDLDFGNPSYNLGASAAVGVENRKGVGGVPWSCFVSNVLAPSTAVRFVPTTALIEQRAESAPALWSSTGLWHLTGSACEPNEHTGVASWYYGQDATCTYNTGVANSGSLLVPTVTDFPADARIAYWHRRVTDGTTDVSKVQLSTTGTGGPYIDLQQLTANDGNWRPAGVTNLFGYGASTVDLRFYFDTINATANGYLGWMVDDIQLVGCDAQGVTSYGATAQAYTQSDTYCEGTAGLADAVGSSCADSGAPSGYQWKENGGTIPGATGITYTIPSSKAPGSYGYSVEITCPGGSSDLSEPASASIMAKPGKVGPTLRLEKLSGGTTLKFTWTNSPSSADYVVFGDTVTSGPFTVETGTATDGAEGLTVATPQETRFYLVAGRNWVCGCGAKN